MNLVCDDKGKVAFLLSLTSMSAIVGRPISGWISDRFGRKTALYFGLCLFLSSCLISPILLQDFRSWAGARLLKGLQEAYVPTLILGNSRLISN